MRKLTGAALSLLVGAAGGAVVGITAARLSHVSTFILSGSNVSDGSTRAVGYHRSIQSMVTPAIVYGVAAALVVVVVAACFRVRIVKEPSRGRGSTLTALCLVAGVLVSSAPVLLAHYGSYTAVIRADQLGAVRPSWLPSLPIAIGIGAVLGALGVRALKSAGMRLASSEKDRRLHNATSTT